MFQSILRNWLLGTAREHMQAAAAQAAVEASRRVKTAAESAPPSDAPPPCHVALVFALGIEAGGLVDQLSGVIRSNGAGFVAHEGGYRGKRIVVVESGVGCAHARRATQALVLGHRPRWIVSTGFAGALSDKLAQGDMLLANQLVDVEGRQLEIDFRLNSDALAGNKRVQVGRLLTTDRIIRDPVEKQALGERHSALAVDMESFAVAEVCRDEKTRFMAVRVISDAMDHELPADIDYLVRRNTTAGRLGAAAGAVLRRPGSVKDMWQLKENALVASDRLAKFLLGVVEQLP